MFFRVWVSWGRPLGCVLLVSIWSGGVLRYCSFRGVMVCLLGVVLPWLCHILRRRRIACGCQCGTKVVSFFRLFIWGVRKRRMIGLNPWLMRAITRPWKTWWLVCICLTRSLSSWIVHFSSDINNAYPSWILWLRDIAKDASVIRITFDVPMFTFLYVSPIYFVACREDLVELR